MNRESVVSVCVRGATVALLSSIHLSFHLEGDHCQSLRPDRRPCRRSRSRTGSESDEREEAVSQADGGGGYQLVLLSSFPVVSCILFFLFSTSDQTHCLTLSSFLSSSSPAGHNPSTQLAQSLDPRSSGASETSHITIPSLVLDAIP